MSKKYDVYAIGNALVDYVIDVEDSFFGEHHVEKSLMTLVDENRQKELVEAVQGQIKEKQGGGSAANSIVALSKLGGKGYYSCKVASDPDGQVFLNDLLENGIDTNLKSENLQSGITGKCLVMVSADADRTMNTFLGITSDFSVAELEVESLTQSEYLFIEGYLVTSSTGLECMKYAKQIAEENGVKVSLTFSDPSMVKYFKSQMQEVVGQGVDLLFCNEEEAMLFTDSEQLAEAMEKLKSVSKEFVITMGENGALVYDGREFIEIAPNKVQAIDTVGAGDMFSGAYLYGITSGLSHLESGNLASMASAAVVAKYGPRLDTAQLMAIKSQVLSK